MVYTHNVYRKVYTSNHKPFGPLIYELANRQSMKNYTYTRLWKARKEEKKIERDKRRKKHRAHFVFNVIDKDFIGCIVIINIIVKFNGSLFAHESFTLVSDTHIHHIQQTTMTCMSSQNFIGIRYWRQELLCVDQKRGKICLMPSHIPDKFI